MWDSGIWPQKGSEDPGDGINYPKTPLGAGHEKSCGCDLEHQHKGECGGGREVKRETGVGQEN